MYISCNNLIINITTYNNILKCLFVRESMAVILKQVISNDKEGLIGIAENENRERIRIPLAEPYLRYLKFDSVLDGLRPLRKNQDGYMRLYRIIEKKFSSEHDERSCIKISRILLTTFEEKTSAIVLYNSFERR